MRRWRLSFGALRLRHIMATIFILAFLGGIGAVLVAWSGAYNVAASRGHWPITNWFLHFTLRNSVETHSLGIRPPGLDDPALIRLGAGHFAAGCAFCHGAPGDPPGIVVRHMLPKPPDLSNAAREWRAQELFWIVQNGFKFTGMPAWPARGRDDEIWAMVAFLQALPELKPEQYRQLAGADRTASDPLSGCESCHGSGGDRPASALVPSLPGLQQGYLERALAEYRSGLRQSGIMQQAASTLSDADIVRLARHYAALPIRPAPEPAEEADRIARGREIAERGLREAGVPACLSCHERPGSLLFPRLSGQQARYITGQLAVWRNGMRRLSAPGQIMAVIATRLPADAAADVAAYFQARDATEVSQ